MKQIRSSPIRDVASHDGERNSEKKRSAVPRDGEQHSEKSAADSGTSVSSTGIVYSLFQAQFRSVVKCLVCHKESSSVEPFLFVPLPLPDSSFSVSATVVRSHPHQSVLKTSLNVSCLGYVRDLRMSVAAAANMPAEQVCYTIHMLSLYLTRVSLGCTMHHQMSSFGMTAAGFFRSTLLSRPNKVGLKCPSIRPYVRTSSVRPQKVSSISMKLEIGKGR